MKTTTLKDDLEQLEEIKKKYQNDDIEISVQREPKKVKEQENYLTLSFPQIQETIITQKQKTMIFNYNEDNLISKFEEITKDDCVEKKKSQNEIKENSLNLKEFIKQMNEERKKKFPHIEGENIKQKENMKSSKIIDLSRLSENERKKVLSKHTKDEVTKTHLKPTKQIVKSEKQKEAKPSKILSDDEKLQKKNIKIKKKMDNDDNKEITTFKQQFQRKCGIFSETGKPIFEFNQLLKFLFLKDYNKENENESYDRIPKKFKSFSDYSKIFEYLFLNESSSQIKQELQKINKSKFRRIQIKLDETEADKDGSIFQIRMYQKQYDKEKEKDKDKKQNESEESEHKEEIVCDLTQLKNYIVILSNKFQFDIAKINKIKEKRIIFFGMLIEPQQSQFINQIKIQTFVNRDPLFTNWISVYLFPFLKITTQIREYLMINKICQTPLYPLIMDPKSQPHMIGSDKEKLWNLNTTNVIQNSKIMDPFFKYIKNNFNSSQATAIQKIILQEKGISLLQGPPGTGKTHTLIGLLSGLYEYMQVMNKFPKKKILVCAPSNAAIDEIIYRILQGGLFDSEGNSRKVKLVRLGVLDEESDKSEIIKQVSLEDVAQHQLFSKNQFKVGSDQKTSGELRIELSKANQQIKKINLNDQKEKKLLDELWNKKRQLMQYLEQVRVSKRNQKENYAIFCEKIINEAEIICSTLSTAGTEKLIKFYDSFELLIVDEAAQCTEPSNNIPLRLGMNKMILIGDPKQLPATTFSSISNQTHYNRSLFERILENDFKPFFLDIQYRMHPEIRQFPSQYFYDNKLVDHNSIHLRFMPSNYFRERTLFIDIQSEEIKEDKSFSNLIECNLILEVIKNIKKAIPSQSIGIICAYKAQVRLLRQEMKHQLGDFLDDIQINTVDSFQGQERDIILFSCVRSSPSGGIGFLQDGRRVNVAITRAKNALFIFGNALTLCQCQLWRQFLSNLNKRKLYRQLGQNDVFSFKQLVEDQWFDRQKKMDDKLLQQIGENNEVSQLQSDSKQNENQIEKQQEQNQQKENNNQQQSKNEKKKEQDKKKEQNKKEDSSKKNINHSTKKQQKESNKKNQQFQKPLEKINNGQVENSTQQDQNEKQLSKDSTDQILEFLMNELMNQ